MKETRSVEFPNWFASTPAQENFNKYLEPYKGQPDIKFLQLGAYTGDATVWLLDNILTDKTSHLTDVDTWYGSDEDQHEKIDFTEVEKFYNSRIKPYKNITKFKGTTIEWLKAAPLDYYDFIYVDADHTAPSVLIDAELSFLSLKSGGILAFDDYEWDAGRGEVFNPKPGVNTFLHRHKLNVHILDVGWQLWLVKI